MKLSDLSSFEEINIQCHDNPDADAIGAGFGLYRYFYSLGRKVRLLYGGRFEITKTNLLILTDECKIPLEYVSIPATKFDGLLITVDCQLNGGNVTRMYADSYATIDHHLVEGLLPRLSDVRENLGSCCTLVWKLLCEAGFDFSSDKSLSTALYYGLYSDTNQFAELYNPMDKEMRDTLKYSRSLLSKLKNSNISLHDLETVAVAMLRNIYNAEKRYSILQAEKCDPNILGLISDFLLQVDAIDVCVVYTKLEDGYKLSVRSCVKGVNADELVTYLCEGVGSGGGNRDKAGGFVSGKLYEAKYKGINSEQYFGERTNRFMATFDRACTND